jgi:hypothetical protein
MDKKRGSVIFFPYEPKMKDAKMKKYSKIKTTCLLLLVSLFALPLFGEEGMWPFNQIPLEKIKEDYHLELSQDWIDHVQKASLRISLGGSGSFISKNGLVLTNHHVGFKAISDLSTEEKDLIKEGFLAKTQEEELKCPNMYVDQLISIEDVTERVNLETSSTLSSPENEKLRAASIAKIKEEAFESSGLYPQVVTLFGGAKYHLYLYKRFHDVRLVMAPEKAIAFFGENQDNFEFPRYNLDICFFRVYENNAPYASEHYFSWNSEGPIENEPLFVSGNPGQTQRLFTADHLEFLRDHEVPFLIDFLRKKIASLERFSRKSEENQRIAAQKLFGFYNAEKVYSGRLRTLKETSLIQKKREQEKLLTQENQEPWKTVQGSLEKAKKLYSAFALVEGGLSNYCRSYFFAKQLVRLAEEIQKPNENRLKEYLNSELSELERTLLSEEPLYTELETELMQSSFNFVFATLGETHPISKVLSSVGSVEKLVNSTKLLDRKYRVFLYQNLDKLKLSKDPMIVLARTLDPTARKLGRQFKNKFESVQKEAYAEIAKTLFNSSKERAYPDATFTLRLSYGTMKGYEEKNSIPVPPFTLLEGAFKNSKENSNKDPYTLPSSWLKQESIINKTVPFNFISTNDIIGGNSGSPVINAKGEIVGLVFDGNIHSLGWDYEFSDDQARTINVHTAGILESLKSIYQADTLVDEILAQ